MSLDSIAGVALAAIGAFHNGLNYHGSEIGRSAGAAAPVTISDARPVAQLEIEVAGSG